MNLNFILLSSSAVFCTNLGSFVFLRESKSFVHCSFPIRMIVLAVERLSGLIFEGFTAARIRKLLLIIALCMAFTSTSMAADEVFPYQEYFTVKPPGSESYRISIDPSIIIGQVRLGFIRELSAMQLLSKSADPKSLVAIREVVLDGYILLRSATSGFDEAIGQDRYKSQVSQLKLYRAKVWEARYDLLNCMDELDRARRGDESKIAPAKELLKRAVNRLKSLLAIMSF
jgi:hypothetical protein